MKYYTENELQNFRFEGAYIAETCAVNGIFEMILDNVTILPQNSCNRDIREMRANELKLKIREPEITAFVEEGYKVYDADGNLKEKKEDILELLSQKQIEVLITLGAGDIDNYVPEITKQLTIDKEE